MGQRVKGGFEKWKAKAAGRNCGETAGRSESPGGGWREAGRAHDRPRRTKESPRSSALTQQRGRVGAIRGGLGDIGREVRLRFPTAEGLASRRRLRAPLLNERVAPQVVEEHSREVEGTEDHKQAASLLQRSAGQLHPERTLLSRVGHAGTPHGCALEQQAGEAAKPLTALGPLACQLLQQPPRRGKEESRNVRLRLLPLPLPLSSCYCWGPSSRGEGCAKSSPAQPRRNWDEGSRRRRSWLWAEEA